MTHNPSEGQSERPTPPPGYPTQPQGTSPPPPVPDGGGYGQGGSGYGQSGGYGQGGSHVQGGGYGPPPQQPWGAPERSADSGFISALFDLSFNKFVTLTFAKVIYVIAIVLVALFYIIAVLVGFSESAGIGVFFLLLGWIPALFYIVIARVSLEFAVAMIRTAQNTSKLAGNR